MADYCHEWEPAGLGFHGHGYPEKNGKVQCPPDCLGDFTQMAREWAKKLGDGKEVFLGLCEGHGTRVFLYRYGSQLYIEHATNGAIEWKPQPARSKIPIKSVSRSNKAHHRKRKKTAR
jgi:hypothetical protein